MPFKTFVSDEHSLWYYNRPLLRFFNRPRTDLYLMVVQKAKLYSIYLIWYDMMWWITKFINLWWFKYTGAPRLNPLLWTLLRFDRSTIGIWTLMDISICAICLIIRSNPKVGWSTRMHCNYHNLNKVYYVELL